MAIPAGRANQLKGLCASAAAGATAGIDSIASAQTAPDDAGSILHMNAALDQMLAARASLDRAIVIATLVTADAADD